ncbi:hypothetical protein L484_013389 [Morus notabilis]|uniref:Uncharacterized protein n=1 Tax=Morus notabilis TaxID=981085 RepID=W9QYZ8_9ROSA|nr:hypothetical protein L484_013389 [Morus notabilis]
MGGFWASRKVRLFSSSESKHNIQAIDFLLGKVPGDQNTRSKQNRSERSRRKRLSIGGKCRSETENRDFELKNEVGRALWQVGFLVFVRILNQEETIAMAELARTWETETIVYGKVYGERERERELFLVSKFLMKPPG